jgi:uncharacterized membrane protein
MTLPVAAEVAEKQVAKKAATKAVSQSNPPKSAPKKEVVKTTEKAAPKSVASRGSSKSKFSSSVSTGRKITGIPKLKPAKSTVRYRQVLAAEVIVGLIVILTEPGVNHQSKAVDKTVEQAAAFLITFFILAVMTNAGPSAARVSATLGGVIMLVLLMGQSDTLFTRFSFAGNKGKGIGYNDGSQPLPEGNGLPPIPFQPRPPGWQGQWPPPGTVMIPPNAD